MRIRYKPKLFLTAGTEINREGVDQFLSEEGLAWPTDTEGVSSAALLTELAGRLCYMSWGEDAKSKSNKRYIDNLLGRHPDGTFRPGPAHGSCLEHSSWSFLVTGASRGFCYHPDVEVYTGRGWRRVSALSKDEEILTRNPTTGRAEWETSQKVHDMEFEGELLSASHNSFIYPPVTPDHTLWCAPRDIRAARGMSLPEHVKTFGRKTIAAEVYGRPCVVDLGVSRDIAVGFDALQIGKHIYDKLDFFTWLGWMATDGTTSARKDGRSACSIAQKKSHEVKEIRDLMNRLFNDRWREKGPYGGGCSYFTVSDKELQDFTIETLGEYKHNRSISRFITEAEDKYLKAFWEASMKGDGTIHKKNGHKVLYTPSLVAAGQYQYIVARLGMTANIREDDRRGQSREISEGVTITNNEIMYIVSVGNLPATTIRSEHWAKVPFKGQVYCPQTENGVVLVRYSGSRPVWSGNSHELVRHRVGVAYSQLSTRYCNFERDPTDKEGVWDPGFCVPALAQLTDHTKEHFVIAYKESVRAYDDAVTLITEDMMANEGFVESLQKHPERDRMRIIRKAARGSARSLLPIGTEAILTMTLNARSIWNMAYLRASEHAEGEIRDVFTQVIEIMEREFPEVFNTIVYETLWDASKAVNLPRAKL
jgi:flavin-dependent thymidylate synthase